MATKKPDAKPSPIKHRYTDEQKAQALAILASVGGNVAAASRACGIPERTIAFWRERPMSGVARASTAVREELLQQSIERLIWKALRRAGGKIEDAKLSSVSGFIAVLFDRWRLLRSNPTTDPSSIAPAQLDLSRLSANELRALLQLIEKAGGAPSALGIGTAPEHPIVDVTPGGREQEAASEPTGQGRLETDDNLSDESLSSLLRLDAAPPAAPGDVYEPFTPHTPTANEFVDAEEAE